MTGADLANLRRRTGLGVVAFGRRLGYEGAKNTVSVRVRRLERQLATLAPAIIERARAVERALQQERKQR